MSTDPRDINLTDEQRQLLAQMAQDTGRPWAELLEELFAAFAANFVRWAAVWLHEACVDLPPPLSAPQPSVKRLVRIAANTTAWVSWQPTGCLLRFTELSAFAGIQLIIKRSTPFQLALPFLESVDFSPI